MATLDRLWAIVTRGLSCFHHKTASIFPLNHFSSLSTIFCRQLSIVYSWFGHCYPLVVPVFVIPYRDLRERSVEYLNLAQDLLEFIGVVPDFVLDTFHQPPFAVK